MKLNGIVLSENNKTVAKGYILHDPTYMAFLKRQNYKDEEQLRGKGWGRRKRKGAGYGYKILVLELLWVFNVVVAIYMIIHMW